MQINDDSRRCPNCISSFPEGAIYCPNCGQKRLRQHDQSVWHLMVESVGDFFHFESKFFATLWPLMFHPGALTGEFLAGRRMRYFQPFKLFLFLSFLYFLTSGMVNHWKKEDVPGIEKPSQGIGDTTLKATSKGNYKLSLSEAYTKGINIPDDSLRRMVRKHGLNRFINIRFPNVSAFERYMIKKVIKDRLEEGGSFTETMNSMLPKLVFLLIPFFAFLLMVLYRKTKASYFAHMVFSLHFLSFFFLLYWFKELLNLISPWFNPVIIALLLIYLFLALRKVYVLSTWGTVVRFVLFLFGSLITLLIFIILATSISFMMM